ncbi:disease resistance protein RPV1-like isoform X2 [Daucus carota subsp. sativus]|uniref:disease resistance protein RPV1-like isoform X2 n=1 Tax=Daucus carota subsp. sativus TaxID=79200 RepID=UPI0030833499
MMTRFSVEAIASPTPHSSASAPPSSWDVFLSFRGTDTRYTFTDHLYNALDCHGIRVFMDDPELRTGEIISDALLEAIQESKIYIVVLSENYASSSWCLDELVEICNCYQAMNRLVIVVFYNIEPSVVRYQTGSYKKAFRKHKSRSKIGCFRKATENRRIRYAAKVEKMDKWRLALSTVASFSGKEISSKRSEAYIINEIVNEILLNINPKVLDVAKYPVGLDSRVEEIRTLLSSDTENVTKIGIYGMGGVGKTTLAKALFNRLLLGGSFTGSCFLANVREVSAAFRGLESLQQKLLNDVLKSKKRIEVDNVEEGTKFIRERTCSAKVLVLIDDIYDRKQYESLVGAFASGSVVILTTRDEETLDKIKVEPRYRYLLKELDDAESLALFTQYAFESVKPNNTLMELSEDILRLAGGLPLALEVFGSYLSTQSEVGWKSYIKKLQRDPDSSIQQKLLISLSALELEDRMLKNMFLDIACFFIGKKKTKVVEILETYYSYAEHSINILQKRCLLTVNQSAELRMHDLLRDMGREIAHNTSPDEPGKHSRLWILKDIHDVLNNHTGTEAIEGIICYYFEYEDPFRGESIAMETFRRMSKLRFLYLKGVNLTGSFKHTLEDLRWFCWDRCPLMCLPSDFDPQKLVILELTHSKIRTMWELNMVSQVFENLKTLNMSYSSDLITGPDFTKLPFLETLNLERCEKLEKVHTSIGSLQRLITLNLKYCSNLRSLPDSICNLRALEVLIISKCSRMEALPINLGNIESLKVLDAGELAVLELPNSMGCLHKLVKLDLSHNYHVKTLPNTICNLRALKWLNIGCCTRLEALPTELGDMESLEELNLEVTSVFKLPDSVGCLSKLVALNLGGTKLLTLPDTICNLRALKVLSINSCRSLEALPTELGNIRSLKELNMSGVAISELPESVGHLSKLVVLGCTNGKLVTLPETICNLRALEFLYIAQCNSLRELPIELGNIKSLKVFKARELRVSRLPNSVGSLTKLVELDLSENHRLESLPDTICNLRALEKLNIRQCSSLETLPTELGNLKSLKELNAEGLAVSILPVSIGCLSNLVVLRLSGNRNLEILPDTICNLRELEVLDINGCIGLEELPMELGNLDSLKELIAENLTVPVLPNSLGCLTKLVELKLSNNYRLKTLPDTICDLTALKNLELVDCCSLLFIQKLPLNLKWICTEGCTSMERLPDLSSLTKLEILDLAECSLLTELQGLKELISIRTVYLGGCNSALKTFALRNSKCRLIYCRTARRLHEPPVLLNWTRGETRNMESLVQTITHL